MPKANYSDFINSYSALKTLADNKDAQAVFEILNMDKNIYAAIEVSKKDKPALSASVDEIEEFIDGRNSDTFTLSDFNKQAIGRMQKVILAPFGYVPNGKKKAMNSKYFSTASCYEFKEGTAAMRLKIAITNEEISR